MPCLNPYSRDIRHFYKNPVTGEFEPMEITKEVDLNIGGQPRYDQESPYRNIVSVHVTGLETYEQVKDLIGYVHSLVEKK